MIGGLVERFIFTRLTELPGRALLIVVSSFLCVIAICIVACLIWSLNRGFDTLDEGSYLLLYARPADYFFFSSWYQIIAKLPHLCANEIIHFRLLNLVSRMVSGTFLGVAVYLWTKRFFRGLDFRFAACLCLVGLITNATTGAMFPQTISYNSLTSFLLFCASAALLYARSSQSKRAFVQYSAVVFAGLCGGLCFFSKPTSCIAYLLLTPLMAIGTSRRTKLLIFAYLLLGVLLSVTMYFTLFDNPQRWFIETKLLIESELADRTHLKAKGFERTFAVIGKQIGRLLIILGPIIIAVATRRKYPRLSKVSSLVVLFSVFYALRSSYYEKFDAYYAVAVGAFAILILHLRKNSELASSKAEFVGGLLFLALVPFCASFGTNNVITLHAVSNICPLMLMSVLCVLVVTEKHRTWAFALSCIVIAALSVVTFVRTFVINPSRLPEPIYHQRYAVIPGTNMSGLFVDPETKQMIDELKTLLDQGGFKAGDPILAFYDVPGLVYAVGGRSIGIPWFSAYTPEMNLKGLDYVNKASYPRLFMVVTAGSSVPDLLHDRSHRLTLGELNPNIYVPLGVVHGPRAQIKPRRDTIYVYRVN